MDMDLLIPLLITSVVVIVGWFIIHWLSSKRDQNNKRRELRVQYLIEAWRKLENSCNRNDITWHHDLESAIADIQLFGSPEQIVLAENFIQDFTNKENHGADADELLNSLRQDLRKELQLEAIQKKHTKHIRFYPKSESTKNKK
jgi:hypothetical protein